MINFLQLHERAHQAGEAARDADKGYARIALPHNSNFTRWAKRQGFMNVRPAGYARAYVNVLQQAGELARVEP